MNKIIFLTLSVLMTAVSANGQCNCQKINRSDGTRVTQCQPLPIAYDNTTQVGIAAASNGKEDFITLTVRFSSTARRIAGNLAIRLEDNNLFSLELVNSQLAYIGNSQVAQAIYSGTNTALNKLSKSALKTISFKLTGEPLRTYQIRGNIDVLVKQLRCF